VCVCVLCCFFIVVVVVVDDDDDDVDNVETTNATMHTHTHM